MVVLGEEREEMEKRQGRKEGRNGDGKEWIERKERR